MTSEKGKQFADCIIENCEEPAAIVIAVQHFFEMGDRELDQMIQLFGEDEVQKEIQKLLTTCCTQLADMKTEKISDKLQLLAEKQYGAVVAEKIGHILDQAQEVYEENHSGGFFSKLFRGFGKNKK